VCAAKNSGVARDGRPERHVLPSQRPPELLLRTNKPDGFDCPGCAWPDKEHTSTFQFCENGAKAVTWEATKRRPIDWDTAFARIGEVLRMLPSPDMAEFYTSGRASNEAAFLFNIFAREFGTNNFPDCSNMCHEATSVGLPRAIGVGKGTVSLEDFDHCDLIIAIGHNPGTNHPRMMGTLHQCARRGVPIIVINPSRSGRSSASPIPGTRSRW
jgi:hypothetical protein